MKNFIKERWRLITIVIIILLSLITTNHDYKRALKEKPPAFAIQKTLYKDGGTAVYYGLGYKVTDYNQVNGRKDVVFTSLFFNK